MDIGKGLEHLALMFVLIVLGCVAATLCLAALAVGLMHVTGYVVRTWRGTDAEESDPGPPS